MAHSTLRHLNTACLRPVKNLPWSLAERQDQASGCRSTCSPPLLPLPSPLLLSPSPPFLSSPHHSLFRSVSSSVFPSVKWRQPWSYTPFCLPGMIWERVRSCLGRLGELQRRPKINSRQPNCLEEQRLPQPQFHSPIIVGGGRGKHSSAVEGLIASS